MAYLMAGMQVWAAVAILAAVSVSWLGEAGSPCSAIGSRLVLVADVNLAKLAWTRNSKAAEVWPAASYYCIICLSCHYGALGFSCNTLLTSVPSLKGITAIAVATFVVFLILSCLVQSFQAIVGDLSFRSTPFSFSGGR